MNRTTTPPQVRFFVPGNPRPQGSKTFKGMRGGRPILTESSKHVAEWRATVTTITRHHTVTPTTGPVEIILEFVMPRTKTMGTKPAPPMVQQPDLDKLVRAVLDGIVDGGGIEDDSFVTAIQASKRRAVPGEDPGVNVTVRPDETVTL